MFKVPERYRVEVPGYPPGDSQNGCFAVKLRHAQVLRIIASNGAGWEHVSVSRNDRTPTWDEMCQVKALFWEPEDCVIQYHPPASEYVNNHPHCLHLWRPVEGNVPMPPALLVGIRGA